MSFLLQLVGFAGAALSLIIGARASEAKQFRTLEKQCAVAAGQPCTCGTAGEEWPLAQNNIRNVAFADEPVKRYPFFVGGVMFCTPYGPRRVEIVQRVMLELERRQLYELTGSDVDHPDFTRR